MKKTLFFACFLFWSQLCAAQLANTNLSNGISFDGEPFLAINPANPQNLVAAWMGLKLSNGLLRIAIKTRASMNGGQTWSTANTLPHFGTGFGSADVSMAFDKNGTLYLSYIDYRQLPDSGGVYVARSINGGLTWDAPSKAFDAYEVPQKRPIDRPWLVVDRSSTANAGTLYLTTKPAPWIAPPNRNYFKVSTDGGHNWSAIANIDGGTHLVGNLIAAPMAAPAATLDGKFCAIYPSYVPSQNPLPAYYLAKSTNQGQTFDYTTVLTALPSALDTNFKNGYQLLANPADANQMAFLLISAMAGDADIMALHSNDGGQNWSSPVRVNDDELANGKGQDMVWAAYNETGKLAVAWRDRRGAAANGFWGAGYEFYYAISDDNGQTFSANHPLSNQFMAFDTVLTQNGNDFMSCVYQADTLYAVWGDTRSGRMNIYFAKTIASSNMNVSTAQLDGDPLSWSIYPNPGAGDLNVRVPQNRVGEALFLLDGRGKVLMQQEVRQTEFQVGTSALAPGTYYVRLGKELQGYVKTGGR